MRSTSIVSPGPDPDCLRSYDGYLVPERPLDERSLQLIRVLGERAGISFDLDVLSIEFQFIGRDTNRFVVRFLQDLAKIVENTRGEVCCTVSGNASDPKFEFFSIRGGCLIRQFGIIVRTPEEQILD